MCKMIFVPSVHSPSRKEIVSYLFSIAGSKRLNATGFRYTFQGIGTRPTISVSENVAAPGLLIACRVQRVLHSTPTFACHPTRTSSAKATNWIKTAIQRLEARASKKSFETQESVAFGSAG